MTQHDQPLLWPSDNLDRIEDYRSTYERQRQIDQYGTDAPVAFVTGSSAARVGNMVARHFAARGYRIVLHAKTSIDRGEQMIDLCKSQGIEAMLVSGDISEEAIVTQWVEQIGNRFQRIDAVVHCAATWDMLALEQTTAGDVERNLRKHTLGSFMIAQKMGLAMVAQPTGGSITLIGDWALDRPYPAFAAYFAGKASIPTLTRTFAVELGTRNPKVRTNGILPGTVLLGEGATDDTRQQLCRAALTGRIGTPHDIAQAALFLAENTFVTGVCLPVDGGRHCYAGPGVDAIAHPEMQ